MFSKEFIKDVKVKTSVVLVSGIIIGIMTIIRDWLYQKPVLSTIKNILSFFFDNPLIFFVVLVVIVSMIVRFLYVNWLKTKAPLPLKNKGSIDLVFTFGGMAGVNVYSGPVPLNELDALRYKNKEAHDQILNRAQGTQIELRNYLGYTLINAQLHIEAIRANRYYRIIENFSTKGNRQNSTINYGQNGSSIIVVSLGAVYQNIPIPIFEPEIQLYVYAKENAIEYEWICTINADNLDEPIIKKLYLLAVPYG